MMLLANKLEHVSGKPGLIYDGKASTTVFPSIQIFALSVYEEKQFWLLLSIQSCKPLFTIDAPDN